MFLRLALGLSNKLSGRRLIIHKIHLPIPFHADEDHLLSLTSHFGKHANMIESIVKNSGCTVSKNIPQWTNFIKTLNDYGFEESDCFKIISCEPQVLTIPNSELRAALERWHQSKLNSEYVHFLILNNPKYLYVPQSVLAKRIPLLHSLVKTSKSLVLLLLQCPNVVTEQWEQLESKIDYLSNVMRVEKAEIFQSRALNKPLNLIKMRHELLLKCGLYVAPSQYAHKRGKNEKSAFRNPHLKRIVDNEDTSFARKICKISVEEYDAFQILFEQKIDETSDSELLSDSDSESE